MWTRDIVFGICWAIFKFGALFLTVTCGYAFVCALLGTNGTSADRGALFFSSLVLGCISLWTFHNITALPLLIWRRRKFHVFRVLYNEGEGERAMQIRLFGIWFYIGFNGSDAVPVLTLCGNDELHRLHTWRSWNEDTMEREIRLLIDRIKPPTVQHQTAEPIVYENYQIKQ